MAAVFAAVYAYRKQRLTESEAHLADRMQYTSRYTMAAEQLGHDAAAVRLAGMYALARLADDWEDQRQTCIDVLCAYLRMPFDPTLSPEQVAYLPGESEVRASCQRVIAEHLRTEIGTSSSLLTRWNSCRFDFRGAVLHDFEFQDVHFDHRVSFKRASFNGAADFKRVKFNGHANFERAQFNGSADFEGAQFNGTADFEGTTFKGYADFCRTRFARHTEFAWATFSDVRFTYAMFSRRIGGGDLISIADPGANRATLSSPQALDGPTFKGRRWFRGATCSRSAEFDGTTFDLTGNFFSSRTRERDEPFPEEMMKWKLILPPPPDEFTD